MADKKFIDLDGLKYFHDQLVEKLAANSADKYTVNYAVSALNDAQGRAITSTYAVKSEADLAYLPMGTTLAGLNLKDTITAAQLVEKLDVVTTVSGDGVTQNGKSVSIDLSNYATKDMIATVLSFRGVKDNFAAIEAVENPAVGDLYIASDSGAEYVWVGSDWEMIGSAANVDLTGYYTSEQIDGIINGLGNTYYTETEVDGFLALKANAADVYTKGEVDLAIAPLATSEQVGKDIEAAKTELSGTISGVEGRVKALEDADFPKQISDAVAGAKSELNGTINGVSDRVKALEDADFGKQISDAEGRLNTAISEAEGRVQGNVDLVNGKIDAMDLAEVTNAAGFISSVSQADGKVSASAKAFDAAVSAESNIAPTSAAVATYVGGQIEAYDATLIAVTNAEIDTIFA